MKSAKVKPQKEATKTSKLKEEDWIKIFRALPLNNARREGLYERIIRLFVDYNYKVDFVFQDVNEEVSNLLKNERRLKVERKRDSKKRASISSGSSKNASE